MEKSKNINVEKYESFVSKLREKEKYHVRKIVEKLVYIKTEELVEMVRKSVRKATSANEKYNLYIPEGKIGSEHYLTMRMKDELNPVSIIRGTDPAGNEYPIIMIDDAIYSSNNMCGTIDDYRYESGCENKIVVVVGVLSTRKVQVLADEYFNTEVIADMEYEDLLPENIFDEYDYEYMYDMFGCETSNVIPIYFEHKIANAFGTYQFINEIIDTPISRKVIDDIEWKDIEEFIESFR